MLIESSIINTLKSRHIDHFVIKRHNSSYTYSNMRTSRNRSGTDRNMEIQEAEQQDKETKEAQMLSQVSARSFDEAAVEEQKAERQRLKDKEESKRQLAKMLMKDGRGNYFQAQSRSEGKERLDFLLK